MATAYPPLAIGDDVAAWTNDAVAADDPRTNAAIDAASAAVRAYCGWHVAPTVSETLILDGPGGHVVALPTMHVVSLLALRERVGQPYVNPIPTVDKATYEWSSFGELRRSGGFWTSLYRALEVDLEHGFPTGSTAWGIAHSLVVSVAARAILSPVSGVVREQTLVSSITYGQSYAGVSGGSTLMPHETAALSPYRLREV